MTWPDADRRGLEETWAGAEPRSLDDNHGHSLLISAELLQIVERAVFRGV